MSRPSRFFTLLILLGTVVAGHAQNPIVPPGSYMADPTARVWDDGKLYIYGSVDESPDYYCSYRYHVLSTSDLSNWDLHKNSFSSDGPADGVEYNDALLYAPDCQFAGDSFYLYYCQPDPDHAEGVAVSDSPTGPFTNATPVNTGEYNQIDPCLFIDDDGQGYYMWGQFTMKMAKMNPDHRTIDPSSLKDSVITESEHHFHEGAHMVKRNGIYYLLFADLSRAGMPSCIGYATSDAPMGPFTYRGVIVDNDHCDPGNWNNHGSMMEYRGQWYVFYHRATHHSKMMRKACMEPIFFNEDGSINEVEMTSQGAGPPLNAREVIPAERACLLHGNLWIRKCSDYNEELGGIREGDRAAFKYIDFGEGVGHVAASVQPGRDTAWISFHVDMPWGPEIGRIQVPGRDHETEWTTFSAPAGKVTGVRALWIVFEGKGDELLSLDWFSFD
jgi:arabinoxylan arabinofuranohydrolase